MRTQNFKVSWQLQCIIFNQTVKGTSWESFHQLILRNKYQGVGDALRVWDGTATKFGCDDCCTTINVIKFLSNKVFLNKEARKRDSYPRKICGDSFYQMVWASMNCMGDWQGFWDFYISNSAANLDRKEWSWNEMKTNTKGRGTDAWDNRTLLD